MIVYHVAVTAAPNHSTGREAPPRAIVEYLLALRQHGALVAAGTAPDASGWDLFCRVDQPDHIAKLVEQSPPYAAGLWSRYALRSFAQFLEPWNLPPPVLDGTRVASIVEGTAPDAEMASFALVEERGAGRLLFGGFFPEGRALAFMTTSDPAAAADALDATGLFTPGSLAGRPLIHFV